jgi:hypothetical protein
MYLQLPVKKWFLLPLKNPGQRLADITIPKDRVYVDDAGLPLDKCTALLNVPAVKVDF